MAKHYEEAPNKTNCPWCMVAAVEGKKCPECGFIVPKRTDFEFGLKYINHERETIAKFDKVTRWNIDVINEEIKEAIQRSPSCSGSNLRKAIENGSRTAIWLLAEYYLRYKEDYHDKLDIDAKEAVGLLCKAAMCGSFEATRMLVLGVSDSGLGRRIEVKSKSEYQIHDHKDHRYYSWSIEDTIKKHVPRYDLSAPMNWVKIDNAAETLREIGDHGIKWAQYLLGYMYYEGKGGVEKDESKSLGLIRAVAKGTKDDPSYVQMASGHMCRLYFDGVSGVGRDIDQAMRYLRYTHVSTVAGLLSGQLSEYNNLDKEFEHYPYREGWSLSRYQDEKGKNVEDWRFRNLTIDNILDRTDLRKDKDKYNYDTYKVTSTNWNSIFDISNELDRKQIVALISEANAKYPGIPAGLKMSYNDGKVMSGNGKIVFSTISRFLFVSDFAIPLSEYDFSGSGISFEDMVRYCAYVRRYVLWDRKEGVKLLDGSVAKSSGECPKDYDYPIRRREGKKIKSCKGTVEERKREEAAAEEERKRKADQKRADVEKKREAQRKKIQAEEAANKRLGCGCLCIIIALICLVIWGPEWFMDTWYGKVFFWIRTVVWSIVTTIAALVCAIFQIIWDLITK